MNTTLETDVLIVGAGPVGLTLAMDLAGRGVQVVVAETARYAEPPNVKCNHVSARTMEQFRRLGVAASCATTACPPDYPNDVAFRTSVTGIELTRIPFPAGATATPTPAGPDGWWPTPEPPHRINQILPRAGPAAPHGRAARRDAAQPHAGHRLRAGRHAACTAEAWTWTPATTRICVPATWWAATAAAPNVRKQIGAKLEGTA
jgi:choline dehydrogenase-like flavoprotein